MTPISPITIKLNSTFAKTHAGVKNISFTSNPQPKDTFTHQNNATILELQDQFKKAKTDKELLEAAIKLIKIQTNQQKYTEIGLLVLELYARAQDKETKKYAQSIFDKMRGHATYLFNNKEGFDRKIVEHKLEKPYAQLMSGEIQEVYDISIPQEDIVAWIRDKARADIIVKECIAETELSINSKLVDRMGKNDNLMLARRYLCSMLEKETDEEKIMIIGLNLFDSYRKNYKKEKAIITLAAMWDKVKSFNAKTELAHILYQYKQDCIYDEKTINQACKKMGISQSWKEFKAEVNSIEESLN